MLIPLTLTYERLFICVFMVPDDELMLLGTIGFALKYEPPGNICGVFSARYPGLLGLIGPHRRYE